MNGRGFPLSSKIGRRLLLALMLGCLPASAAETDRMAIEQLPGETPLQAALAYVDACYRVGVIPAEVRPVQTFKHGTASFVRLALQGTPLVVRCGNALQGRQIVDGTIHWFDGFAGGELRPSGERIPDAEWYRPGATLPSPPADQSFVDELAQGSAAARTKLSQAPLEEALVDVGALIGRGGPGPLAALEIIARTDSHWPVRIAAVDSLDPTLSLAVIMEAALHDSAWEVRLNAATRLGGIASSSAPRAAEAAALLVRIADRDPDWTVQRQALWMMSTAVVRGGASTLRKLMNRPATDPRVVAATLEALGGSHMTDHDDLVRFLHSPAPEPRAIAAELLAAGMRSAADVPLLWSAVNDRARIVRLAAAPFLDRIDDDTLGPALWRLYEAEASQIDADVGFERIVLDALARHPGTVRGAPLEARLARNDLSPDERRLLARALARMDKQAAEKLLGPQLDSPDATVRAVAADAAPDSPAIHAKRMQLLNDPSSDVRAAALIGLCRSAKAPLTELLQKIDLDPTPLGQEAGAEAARCGQHENPPRWHTRLAGPPDASAADDSPVPPALAGLGLLLASVLFDRLRRSA